jgi:hypothetical protein
VSKYQNHGKKLGAIQKQNTLIFWKIVRKKKEKLKLIVQTQYFFIQKLKN